MKALILSDIHSNIYALEAIWARENDSDVVYCTGDLVDYGPYPREVLDWVRDRRVICTQGNHDRWLAQQFHSGNLYHRVPLKERGWVHHNASLLNQEDINYLETLPRVIRFNLDGIEYGMTHLYREYEEIVSLYAFHRFWEDTFEDSEYSHTSRLILGHTHRQGVRFLSDEILWLNPGSVSYRRRDDPDQSAHYATLVNGAISLRRVDYDLNPLWCAIQGVKLKRSEMQVAEFFFGERSSTHIKVSQASIPGDSLQ